MNKVTAHTSKLYSATGPQWKGTRPKETYRAGRLNRQPAHVRLKEIRKKMGLSRSQFDHALWKTRLLQAKTLREPLTSGKP
jgi:hypothetical protein